VARTNLAAPGKRKETEKKKTGQRPIKIQENDFLLKSHEEEEVLTVHQPRKNHEG